jgi:hypothetical protein
MAPLTWRNVDQPSFAASNDLLRYAGQAFNAGFDIADKTVGQYQDASTINQSNALMAEALKYQDPAAFQAALKAGTMMSGVDPRYLNKNAFDFVNGRVSDLIQEDQAASTLAGTDILNDVRKFGLTKEQTEYARLQSQRELQPAANDLITEMRTLALSGDPASLARMRQIGNDNSTLFTNAGYDVNSILGWIGGNEEAFQTGMANNQNIKTVGNWWDASNATDASKLLVQDVIGQTANAGDAIKLLQNNPDIPKEVLKLAVEDLTANGGAYYAQPDLIDTMLGAPAGMGDQESGNDSGAINRDEKGNIEAAGKYQFTNDRLQDAIAAGVVPAGTTLTEFAANPAIQEAANRWHWNDINKFITSSGVQQYLGQTINGVPITIDSMRAMAQLGGNNGMKRFLESGGTYDPADSNGTKLSDYGKKFAGGGAGSATTDATANVPSSSEELLAAAATPTVPGEIAGASTTQTIINEGTSAAALNNQLAPVDNALINGKFKNMSPAEIAQELKKTTYPDLSIAQITESINQIAKDGEISFDLAAILAENSPTAYTKKNVFGEKPVLDILLGTPDYAIDSNKAAELLKAYQNPERKADLSRSTARLKAFQDANKVAPTLEVIDAMESQELVRLQTARYAAENGKKIDLKAAEERYATAVKQFEILREDLAKTNLYVNPEEDEDEEVVVE